MWDKIWFYIQDFGWPFIIDLGSMLLKLILIITIMLVVLEILKAIGVLKVAQNILQEMVQMNMGILILGNKHGILYLNI